MSEITENKITENKITEIEIDEASWGKSNLFAVWRRGVKKCAVGFLAEQLGGIKLKRHVAYYELLPKEIRDKIEGSECFKVMLPEEVLDFMITIEGKNDASNSAEEAVRSINTYIDGYNTRAFLPEERVNIRFKLATPSPQPSNKRKR